MYNEPKENWVKTLKKVRKFIGEEVRLPNYSNTDERYICAWLDSHTQFYKLGKLSEESIEALKTIDAEFLDSEHPLDSLAKKLRAKKRLDISKNKKLTTSEKSKYIGEIDVVERFNGGLELYGVDYPTAEKLIKAGYNTITDFIDNLDKSLEYAHNNRPFSYTDEIGLIVAVAKTKYPELSVVHIHLLCEVCGWGILEYILNCTEDGIADRLNTLMIEMVNRDDLTIAIGMTFLYRAKLGRVYGVAEHKFGHMGARFRHRLIDNIQSVLYNSNDPYTYSETLDYCRPPILSPGAIRAISYAPGVIRSDKYGDGADGWLVGLIERLDSLRESGEITDGGELKFLLGLRQVGNKKANDIMKAIEFRRNNPIIKIVTKVKYGMLEAKEDCTQMVEDIIEELKEAAYFGGCI